MLIICETGEPLITVSKVRDPGTTDNRPAGSEKSCRVQPGAGVIGWTSSPYVGAEAASSVAPSGTHRT